jgi:SurA N-terminal domain/PPIC-type PPIASE domain
MPPRRFLVALVALMVSLALAGCGNSQTPAPAPTSPVAQVGKQSIPRSLFDLRMTSALTAIQQGGGPQQGSTGYDAMLSKLRADVLKSLILDSIIAQEAAYRHLAAGDADVQQQVDADIQAAGGSTPLQTQLAEAGGSMAQLRDAIRSRINEQRLEDEFAKERAAAIVQRLAAGEDFAVLAKLLSDDETNRDKGGDMGTIADAQLDQGDKQFAAAVRAVPQGKTSAQPARDQAGYEILRVDAVSASGHAVHRILVAAPQPYTVKERPNWFLQSLLDALSQYCSQGQLKVMVSGAAQPCATAAPSGSASAAPASPSPSPSATH